MKVPFITLPALLVLALGCNNPNEPASGAEAGDDIPAIDALFATWDKPGLPGCAVAVARQGEIIYSRGYGYANLDYDLPMTPQTVVDVASINKQFMAAMVNMLALEQKLSLDDNVRKWLPELPEPGPPITLRHMIYHTSGLRDYLALFPLAGRDHYYPISHAQILDMMSRQRALNFLPGERYEYSNTAYMLLAQVIERASGQSLADFAEARIFSPLGMHASMMYDNYEKIIPRRATGYDRHDDRDIRMVHNYNFDVPGDGQLYSTVEDLLRWDEYLHGADKPAFYDTMLTEGILNSGERTRGAQGLGLGEYRGLRTIHHTGSSWGSTAILVRFVDPGLSVAITCNDGMADRWPMVRGIADYYLADKLGPAGKSLASGSNDVTADPVVDVPRLTLAQRKEFVGIYFSEELDAIYRFAISDDLLTVRIEQELPLAIDATGTDRFTINFGERAYAGVLRATMDFDRDAAGDVIGFRLNSGTEKDIVFTRQRDSGFGEFIK